MGIPAIDIADTLRVLLGGDDVTRFKRGNELYDVIVQLAAGDRFAPTDLAKLYTRSAAGDLIPLANFVNVTETVGPEPRKPLRAQTLGGVGTPIWMAWIWVALSTRSRPQPKLSYPSGFSTALAGESRGVSAAAPKAYCSPSCWR